MTSPRSSGSAPPLDPRTRVQFLPGIGPQRALAFERLGITTLEHLVRHVPRTWLDASRFVKVRDLRPGELVTVMGTIKHASALRTRGDAATSPPRSSTRPARSRSTSSDSRGSRARSRRARAWW
jgi:hypothetical protein